MKMSNFAIISITPLLYIHLSTLLYHLKVKLALGVHLLLSTKF